MTRYSRKSIAGACILIGGPTAVGKSQVAMLVAERVGGEIVSVDSMQVYRGMDIGTAKPSREDRARVPHHLIDVVDVSEQFNAARFVELAEQAVSDIISRRKVPILCGGTGLYFKAFLEGIGQGPPPNPELRKELESQPIEALLEELAMHDPSTYAVIDRRNKRRLVRALEVIRLTGRPFSQLKSPWEDSTPSEWSRRFFILNREPDDLRRRIYGRVDKMFEAGLVEETRRLLESGLASNPTAMQAIGYRQVVEYLRGERSLADTVELVKKRTWEYARRQLSWFRHQLCGRWILIGQDEPLEVVAEKILEVVRKGGD